MIVFLVCLLATAGATTGIFLKLPAPYKASTLMVVLSPGLALNDQGTTIAVNPWQVAGSNPVQVTASALASVAGSKPFTDSLAAKGVSSTPDVAVSMTGGGVVLDVSVTNAKSAKAADDLAILTSALADELQTRQASVGAPPESYLRLADLTGTSSPVLQTSDRTKLAGIVGALGLLITIGAVVIVDARSKRTRPATEPGDDEAESHNDAAQTDVNPQNTIVAQSSDVATDAASVSASSSPQHAAQFPQQRARQELHAGSRASTAQLTRRRADDADAIG